MALKWPTWAGPATTWCLEQGGELEDQLLLMVSSSWDWKGLNTELVPLQLDPKAKMLRSSVASFSRVAIAPVEGKFRDSDPGGFGPLKPALKGAFSTQQFLVHIAFYFPGSAPSPSTFPSVKLWVPRQVKYIKDTQVHGFHELWVLPDHLCTHFPYLCWQTSCPSRRCGPLPTLNQVLNLETI